MNIFDKEKDLSTSEIRKIKDVTDFNDLLKCRVGSILKLEGENNDEGSYKYFFVFLGARQRVVSGDIQVKIYGAFWKNTISQLLSDLCSLHASSKLEYDFISRNYQQTEILGENEHVFLVSNKSKDKKLRMKDFK